MGLLADWQIEKLVTGCGMIEHYAAREKRPGVISYGQTSYGYDMRLARRFRVFTPSHCRGIDPKDFDSSVFDVIEGDYCWIPANSFALAESVERFNIPDDVLAVCTGKSTYARCGLVVPITPLEPGWHGVLTIELSNTAPVPLKVYAEEGIAQLLFFRGVEKCQNPYGYFGQYQGQIGITTPRVMGAGF
jgi:dCTP deaminase